MESSTASSRFRFRDHQQYSENATESDASSVTSSVSSDRDDQESEIESMTGKGINRLCMELLEIKEASDEDFHANIFANYSAFVGINEEVKDMEKELTQLRTHVAMHRRLVEGLMDGAYLKVLSDETMELVTEESVCDDSYPGNELEADARNVSETLDVLLSENRTDEAVEILEMEEDNLQKTLLKDNIPSDVLMLYSNEISGRRAMLILQLALVAENSRTSAAELQKALVGIRRLGDSHLANQLLLKYYHSRIASGIHNLQRSESYLQGVYIRELSRFVFSMISQAARSSEMLHGETFAYASELIQWVHEEVEVFAVTFTKYIKCMSEISGRLFVAVEAVQFATSYCSLLETQRLVLKPLLIKHLRTCMEEVLAKHVDHFKKVIGIFTATDAWVLGRYLVSGNVNEDCSYIVVEQRPEYCLLTNSGRKFVTLLQVITRDVTPLAALQMECSILSGLVDLFLEYTAILEKAIAWDVNVPKRSGSRVIVAESVKQQVSILANLSTLEHFFSGTVISIFTGIKCIDSEQTKSQSVGFQLQELDSYVIVIQEASVQLRAQFFKQFIGRAQSLVVCKLAPEMQADSETGSHPVHGPMPSSVFQVLFLELRKLNKLSEDNVFEEDWLMELIRELIEAIFAYISNNKKFWETDTGDLNFRHPDTLDQFVLDLHFLVEATRYAEYFSKDPLVPAVLMEAAFTSVGLDPLTDIGDDGWAMKAAAEAMERLLEIERTELLSNIEVVDDLAEVEPWENQSELGNETFQDAATSYSDISSSSKKECGDNKLISNNLR